MSESAPQEKQPRGSLLERHFRGKLQRMYAKTADRQRVAPVKLAKAAEKRARKAQRRVKS